MINVANPRAQYLAHKEEIDAAMARVLESGMYILGEECEAFEREFAAWQGTSHCIGVGSGTDALHLALTALNVGVGDEVITVSHTAVATVSAIELAGAKPVLVDIDPLTYTMDPQALEAVITPRSKAIIPVHLYGHPAEMPSIIDVAERHRMFVVEDCTQAHGATLDGQKVGTFGHIACFSDEAERAVGEILSPPIFPELNRDDVLSVAGILKDIVRPMLNNSITLEESHDQG